MNWEHWQTKRVMEFSKNSNSSLYQKSLTNICLKTKDDITNFDDKKNANIFKKKIFTLADVLLANFPPTSLRFGLNSVRQDFKVF